MEPPQHQNQQHPPNEDSSGGSSKGGSYLCRQSSARWTPTTDQIRILKDLYYNNGVRSPNAEQIQRISARLRQYGKIEGKNVFYWFQNHKARERQKKRFTTSSDVPMQRSSVPNSPWKAEDPLVYNKFPNISHPGYSPASSSSAGVLPVGQMGNYGYGSLNMEKSFRKEPILIQDCSISSSESRNGVSISHGWVGIDPYNYPSYSFFDKRKSSYGTLEEEEEDEEEVDAGLQIETLPLFPIHGEGMNGFCSVKNDPDSFCGNSGSWYRADDGGNNGGSRASLELSLNSYRSQDSL